jgi:Domain of unknown function (DUF4397)
MSKRNVGIALIAALLAVSGSGPLYADSKPKKKSEATTVFTIIHAIPTSFGADKVDVYANDKLIIDNAVPGASKSFTVAPGNQKISIYADGVLPTSETASVLSYRPIYLPKNSNVTFIAHLDAANKPVLNLFKNMNTEPGSKRSWLTVRHVAAAPAVDIRANGKVIFSSLANGVERKVSLRYGTYPVDVVLAGTSTVAIPSANITIKDNINTIVYAWGSASKGNLQYFVQELNTRKSDD